MKSNKNTGTKKRASNSSIFLLCLAVVFTFGIFLRTYKLSDVPSSLYIDEVAMVVDGALVAETGRDMHGLPWWQLIYPSWGDYKQSVYIWAVAISMKVLGTTPLVVKLPSLLAGLGTIIVGGLLAQQLFASSQAQKKIVFLITAFLLSITPWSIIFSRAGFEGHLAQLLLGVAVLAYFNVQKRWWWKIVMIGAAVLSTYTYYSVRFVFPVILLGFGTLELFFSDWKNGAWKQHTLTLLYRSVLPLLIYSILLLPLTLSPFAAAANQFRLSTDSILQNEKEILQSNELRQFAGNSALDRLFYHRYWLTSRELLKNISDHLSLNYLFLYGDSNLRHGTGEHGILLFGMLPFFLVGLFSLVKNDPKISMVLLIWWVAALIPASVPETTPHALRSLNALLPILLLVGYGVFTLYHTWHLSGGVKKLLLSTVSVTLIAVLGSSFISFYHFYFYVYPKLSQDAWAYTNTVTAKTLKNFNSNRDPVYLFNTDEKLFLWLLAFSEPLGVQPTNVSEQGFLLKEFNHYATISKQDELPLQGSFVLLSTAAHQAEIEELYKEKVLKTEVITDQNNNKVSFINYIIN